MSNIGNSKIAEMYVGGTKIAQAYVGSVLVFALPSGYDSYKVHITWSSNDNFNMAGLKINGVQATQAQCTSIWYYQDNTWNELSSSDRNVAIDWSNDGGKGMYGTAIDINFTSDDPVTQVQIHTGKWYGGGSMTVTMHVAGVKDGVETDLGYTSEANSADKTYTINV